MGLRDEFERLGVPDHLLAQIIWAEFDDTAYTAKELVGLARRLFSDGIPEQVEAALQPARGTRLQVREPVHDLRDRLARARRIA
jgi:hypothetical protein